MKIAVVGSGYVGLVTGTCFAETGNYGDYTAYSTSGAQLSTVNFAITYATGFTYGTKIWIDFNDNYQRGLSTLIKAIPDSNKIKQPIKPNKILSKCSLTAKAIPATKIGNP